MFFSQLNSIDQIDYFSIINYKILCSIKLCTKIHIKLISQFFRTQTYINFYGIYCSDLFIEKHLV